MSYFIDDDASQVRELKDKLESLQALVLDSQFSVQQENVDFGQNIIPGANPISRGGAGGSAASFPIRPTLTTISSPSSTQDLDLNTTSGHVFKITCDKDFTLTFSNPPASGTQHEFEIELTNSSPSVARTVTLPSSVRQLSTITIPATTPVSRGIYTMRTNDGGLNYDLIQIVSGTTGSSFSGNLSDLTIDVAKDWNAKNITNLGDLLPAVSAVHDFGSELLPWRIGHFRELEFPVTTSAPTGATDTQISKNTTGNLSFNVDTAAAGFLFYFQGVNKWSLDSTLLTGDNISLTTSLSIADSVTDPTFNGEFRRNVNDLKVFSGGAVRNLSDIGVAAGGADVFLSNLSSPTSVNQNIIPQSGKTLGDSANPWSSLTSNKITLGTAGTFAASDNAIIADAATGMEFNTPTGDLFSFFFNGGTASATIGVSQMRMNSGDFRGTGLNLDDFASDPVSNGEIRRNVNDVKVFSNSAVRNFSKMAEIDKTQTWTADQISDGLNDLGTTANPWNNIVSDNTLFCSNLKVFDTDSDINVFNDLDLQAGNTVDYADNATGATAGADTLPSNPQGFIIIKVNGTSRKVPFYAT